MKTETTTRPAEETTEPLIFAEFVLGEKLDKEDCKAAQEDWVNKLKAKFVNVREMPVQNPSPYNYFAQSCCELKISELSTLDNMITQSVYKIYRTGEGKFVE